MFMNTLGGQKLISDTLELELSLQYGFWDWNLGPLKEQELLLTTEPSL